ncbi:MAG TPA: hypothetical protein VJ817_12715 [Gemmatimonadales bacterium]|nr:hypothetical protein [Gemmatimonadales bacterium]
MSALTDIDSTARHQRWISYAACVWAVLFAAPHIWWALGIPAGFPGGSANHQLMMSSAWRYIYDVIVIILCALAILIALTLLRPPHEVIRRWVPETAAWIASGMLLLRGVAGLLVDGASDPVWWPTFLVGGMLLGGVAWLARVPRSHSA